MVNPNNDKKGYWTQWHQFEVEHGNEDTFRDMLRIKRSVGVAFSTANTFGALDDGEDTQKPLSDEQAMAMVAAQRLEPDRIGALA